MNTAQSLYFLIICICLFSFTEQAHIVKIVNGTNAAEGEFKFMTSLRINKVHDCGASILNEKYVLTAAHCVCNDDGPLYDFDVWSIQYGSVEISATDDRSKQIKNVVCANFSLSGTINDVAVLELETDLPNDGSWAPVNLSTSFDASSDQKGTIIGWGWLSYIGPYPTTLQKLQVDIYSDETCSNSVKYQAEHHICFGAVIGGACYGDSGSALISPSGDQIGSASFITNTCGTANENTPNIYARVSKYVDWINEHSKI